METSRPALGAHYDGLGTTFSLFSAHATSVTLCLFANRSARAEEKQIPLRRGEHHVWSVRVPEVHPGQLYGYRVDGPWQPADGLYFNAAKVLLDPYARAVARNAEQNEALLGAHPAHHGINPTKDTSDNAPFAPLAAVIEDTFDWKGDSQLRRPWHETVIYEAHVKGMTMLHPKVPHELRGTYLGLCSAPIVEHLAELGVTAIELLPVHQHTTEYHVRARGLTNYWGYSTLNYFSPDLRYAADPSGTKHVDEFRTMVQTFHRAGIEVILDVVYNHTAEGDPFGPTLTFRGIDNPTYYRLLPEDRSRYLDFTGCANTLNLRHPRTLQLVMDSLRYWVTEMHVDGFRFDLTSALIRRERDVDLECGFLASIFQDPILSQVKLIAEPWDCASGGYLVGQFPPPWRDWNGQFRDTARMFWRGDNRKLSPLASRIAGSSDMFAWSGRGPTASINFITSHDGYTLRDLVSYSQKHNEANHEENRDGDNNNFSFNLGVEGDTDNRNILTERDRIRRNFIATLMFSAGVPMVAAGDELGKTQRGNNNAYCQDNPMSWLCWELSPEQESFLEFFRKAIAVRRAHPVFQRKEYFTGEIDASTGRKDISWHLPDGKEIFGTDWDSDSLHTLVVVLNDVAQQSSPSDPTTETFVLIFHAGTKQLEAHLPHIAGTRFEVMIDTGNPGREGSNCHAHYSATPRSFVLLRRAERRSGGSE
ncbi:MAG: glycogen debranching protein GlgX [Bdellovibrionota bacterium]